jgi:hypothetical protein
VTCSLGNTAESAAGKVGLHEYPDEGRALAAMEALKARKIRRGHAAES